MLRGRSVWLMVCLEGKGGSRGGGAGLVRMTGSVWIGIPGAGLPPNQVDPDCACAQSCLTL